MLSFASIFNELVTAKGFIALSGKPVSLRIKRI